MRALWNRLASLLRRDRIDRDVHEELRLHTQLTQEALEREGLSADDAHAAAARRVGNTLHVRERARDAWLVQPLDTLAQDVRHAVRLLRQHTAYSLPALGTLALGIGLNTAIFSIVYGLLLKPLPFHEPDALVAVLGGENTPSRPNTIVSWTPPDYQALRTDRSAVADLAAFSGDVVALTGRGGPLQLFGMDVTPNFFDLLGVGPAQGRAFAYTPGATLRLAADDARSVVISDRLWRSAFGADPALLGQAITLLGEPRTVIGILPPDFTFRTTTYNPTFPVDIWLPDAFNNGNRGNAFLQLIGRRQPGVSVRQAHAALDNAARHIPDARFPLAATVVPLHDHVVGPVGRLLVIFAAAVGFVLLIACVNVASLQLARLAARRGELSVRAALGAGRRRLARQLLTESVILALAGGILGIGLAYAVLRLFLTTLPDGELTRTSEISLNLPVLAFCVAISLLVGLMFGALPAWKMADANPDDLRAGTLRATTSRVTLRTRAALVSAQVALTLVLVIGAGLLARSFATLLRVDVGFDTANLFTTHLYLPEETYADADAMHRFLLRMRERLRAIPGDLQAVSAVNSMPFDEFIVRGDFSVEGQPGPKFYAGKLKAESRYFGTMGIPLVEGRDFGDGDGAGAPLVAIVSAQVARDLWPNSSALGRRIKLDTNDWLTIVGVVQDVRLYGLEGNTAPIVYVPYQQESKAFFLRPVTLVVRTSTPDAVGAAIRRVLAEEDPNLPITRQTMFEDTLSRSVAQPRFRSTVLVSFALSALAISTVGIYGLLAYAIAQRRREIGVRLAMGAAPAQIVRLVLRRGLTPVIVGLAVGLVLAVLLTRALQSFLFHVRPTDPLTLAGATLLLALVALAAVWTPARRAARINPLDTLRAE